MSAPPSARDVELVEPADTSAPSSPSATTFAASLAPTPSSASAAPAGDGTAITGRVIRLEGTPVEGAWISEVGESQAGSFDPFGTNDGPVRTDALGRFSVPASPGRRRASAILTGFRPAQSRLVEVVKGASVDAGLIVLAYEGVGTLRARITGADGAPIPGKVRIEARSERGTPPALFANGYEDFTADAQGVAQPLRPLTAGRYVLTARAPWRKDGAAHVVIPAGEVVDATFVLEQGPGFFVRFLDDEASAPVPGVLVGLPRADAEEVNERTGSVDAGNHYQAGSDEEGRAYVSVPALPGEFSLRFRAPGHAGWRDGGAARAPGASWPAVAVGARGLAEDVVIRLVRGRSLEGRVADAAGAPVADAAITAIDGSGVQRRGRTLADGTYAVHGISLPGAAEDTIQVLARPSQRALAWGEATITLAPDAPGARVDLTLEPAASLAGRVLDPLGRPVVGGQLQSVSSYHEARRAQSGPRVDYSYARTTGDGSFRIDGIRPGPIDVVIFVVGGRVPLRRGLDLPAGETVMDLVYEGAAPLPPSGK